MQVTFHCLLQYKLLTSYTLLYSAATALPQLNVTVTGGSGTLTAGQNHLLTCTASGGDSMAYTYMWLKDGSLVSGQTSSTYSFSPLRVTDSGEYNCRVSLGSSNMTSGAVTITVVGELDMLVIMLMMINEYSRNNFTINMGGVGKVLITVSLLLIFIH